MSIEEFGQNPKNKKTLASNDQLVETCPDAECGKEEEKPASSDFCQWASLPNFEFTATSKTKQVLPNGLFSVFSNQGRVYFNKEKLVTDELLTLDDTAQQITNEITTFWESKEKFKEHGFSHRRGYLFYGKAGTGKTCLVHQTLSLIIQRGGLALNCNCNPHLLILALSQIRQIEPERSILCLFEDIDSIIERFGEPQILSLLDGENVVDNVLNIATTNYPENLDKRIVCRPRRFDRIIKIGPPNDDIRRQYFTHKLNLSEIEVEKYVRASKGFTYAAMSDLVISTKCFNLTLEEAASRLKELEKDKSSSEYYSKETGFIS